MLDDSPIFPLKNLKGIIGIYAQQVSLTGTLYYNSYEEDATGLEHPIEISQSDFDGAIHPPITGYTWIKSYTTPKYDTVDGKLLGNQYAVDGNGYVHFPLPGEFPANVNSRETVYGQP